MKKIKYLMMAAVAIAMSLNMSSCKDDEETTTSYNETKFQQEVTEYVKKNKTKDGAILIVAFGSTWEQAFDTFEKVKADYKAKFGNKWDIYLGFSSAICINNAYGDGKDGENGASVTYYDPEHWLNAIGLAGYKQIVVQSLQVIPGEEYRNVRDLFVKNFMNNRGQRFTKEYMKSLDRNVVIGTPLMAEEEDAQELADVLHEESDVKSALAEGIVAFMGHGNPEGYDYYGGNIRYVQLEQALRDKSKNYYVGTVDMDQTLVDDVLENIKGRSFTYEVGTVEVPVLLRRHNSSCSCPSQVIMLTTTWPTTRTKRAGSLCSMLQALRRQPTRRTSRNPAGRTPLRFKRKATFQAWQSVALSASSG